MALQDLTYTEEDAGYVLSQARAEMVRRDLLESPPLELSLVTRLSHRTDWHYVLPRVYASLTRYGWYEKLFNISRSAKGDINRVQTQAGGVFRVSCAIILS